MKVTLEPKNFKDLRSFQKALEQLFGPATCVGTNNVVIVAEYDKTLTAMLRPFPEKQCLEYNLELVPCKCGAAALLMLASEDAKYECDRCVQKKYKKI